MNEQGSTSARRDRHRAGSELATGSITVDGVDRTFLVNPVAGAPRPLVIALHGGGGQARGMVGLTDLARRGASMGFATVFPNGVNRSWNDGRIGPRLARRGSYDDAGFLIAMIDHLVQMGVAEARAVFVCGISNGAFMSDHLARVAPECIAGIGLVAGTAPVRAVAADPIPSRPMPMMAFHGTADPLVPYSGGPIALFRRPGVQRRAARREARAHRSPAPPTIGATVTTGPDAGPRGVCVGAEPLAAEWATASGCDPRPLVERLDPTGPDLAVIRLTWPNPSGVPVILHRIEGGGHTWPGGPQYLPTRVIGPVATTLDATGILLGYFESVLAHRPPSR